MKLDSSLFFSKTWVDAGKRSAEAWRTVDAKYDLSGRWSRFDAVGRWRRFDERFRLTEKICTVGGQLWRPLRALYRRSMAFLERRGVMARAKALWERTGLPRRLRAWEQSQILQARMRQVAERERGGPSRGF